MEKNRIVSFEQGTDALLVEWGDGHRSTFHYVWLRDNAPENRHPSGQKLVDSINVPLDSVPAGVKLNGQLNITWADDNATHRFDPTWLRAHAYETAEVAQRQDSITHWQANNIHAKIRKYSYSRLLNANSLLKAMLQDVYSFGFAILKDVPIELGMVLEAVKLFGYVRETNYGSLFDVKVTPNPSNLAFTSLTLPGHTDNPYRHPVPTLQLLHYLINDVDGGDNTLADGFFVAEELRRVNAKAFDLLATTPVTFRYRDADTDLQHESTIIQTDARGDVCGIRVNSRSIQPFYVEPSKMKAFYSAHQQFGHMLEDDKYKLTLKLSSGDLLLFDNQRVLHGRVGYNSSGGQRHLQGCYADKDSLLSKLAVLKRMD